MSSNKVITISIAAYNVEKYLREAIDSLIDDRIIDDIEVFVIDDGGIDNSYNIAKEYELRYPQSIRAVHKDNGGYGSTVNYSIKNATGKYFKLLDGDDWFDKEQFVKLVELLRGIDVDAVFTKFTKVYKDKIETAINYDYNICDKILNVASFDLNEATPMHTLTYRTSALRACKLSLKEHMLYTDNQYVAIPFINVNTIYFTNINVYNYRLEVLGQSVDKNSLIKHIDESRDISLELAKFYSENVNDSVMAKEYIRKNIASTCDNYVAAIMKMPIGVIPLDRLKNFDRDIKSISTEIYDSMMNLNRKCAKVLKIIRCSRYTLYWIFALFN